MTSKELVPLAEAALIENLTYANQQLGWQLPEESVHCLLMTIHKGVLYSLEECVNLLLDGNKFHRIVDLAIKGIVDNKTLIAWIPAGYPDAEQIEETWNQGYGPFKPVGVMSPKSHFQLRPEELEHLASNWLAKNREVT